MKSSARAGGIGLIVFAVAFLAAFALEASRVSLGFDDGDNPEQSVEFIKQHGRIYEVSGLLQILMTVSLTVGVLTVADAAGQPKPSLALKAATVLGLFAAASYFFNSALRLAAARPLLYIEGLRHEWGVTAYLIVQMVGVQGFMQAAIVNVSFWAIGISLVNARGDFVPRGLSALAVFPAFHLFIGLFGPFLGNLPSGLYPLYALSIFGTILWCLVLGILLLRWKPAA